MRIFDADVEAAAIHIWGPQSTPELIQKLKEVMVKQAEKSLERHYEIVHCIYAEQKSELHFAAVLMGRPGERGHRYYGERCVWCRVNSLDELLYDSPQGTLCPGPREEDWDMRWYPLDKIDEVLKEHRVPVIKKALSH